MLIPVAICFALTTDANGYAWKAASYKEKVAIGKELANTLGKDYLYWVDMLDAFYAVDNWNIQSLKIKDVVAQIPISEDKPGQ